MSRFAFLLSVTLLAGCIGEEPDPQNVTNVPMTQRLKSAAELLAEGDQEFAKENYGGANAVYKLAAEAAEKDGDRGREIEALSQIAHCYWKQGSGKEQGKPYLNRAAQKARPGEPGWERYDAVAALYAGEVSQPKGD